MMDDHYSVLGVRKDAPLVVIKAAYRALSQQYHPDKGGNPSIMARINTAYEVLSDPVKRAEYNSAKRIMPPPPSRTLPRLNWQEYKSPAILGAVLAIGTLLLQLGAIPHGAFAFVLGVTLVCLYNNEGENKDIIAKIARPTSSTLVNLVMGILLLPISITLLTLSLMNIASR